MKSLLKISGLVTFILTEYFICPFFFALFTKKVLMKFTSSTPFIIEPEKNKYRSFFYTVQEHIIAAD